MTTESIPRIKKFACLFSRKSRSLSFFLSILLFNFDKHDISDLWTLSQNQFWRGLNLAVVHVQTFKINITTLICLYIERNPRHVFKSIVNLVKSLCVSIALGTIKMLQFLLSIKAARQPQIHLHNNQLSMIESRNKKKVMELPSIIQHKERGNRFTLLS